jgi:hypothetical protein
VRLFLSIGQVFLYATPSAGKDINTGEGRSEVLAKSRDIRSRPFPPAVGHAYAVIASPVTDKGTLAVMARESTPAEDVAPRPW